MGLVVPPSTVNVTLYQGASFKQSFVWQYGETEEAALPVDMTTATARAQVRQRYTSPTACMEFTSDDDEIVLGVDGTIEINVGPDKTALVPSGNAVWDLEIVWPDGDVCRLLQGNVTVSPEVTR